MCPARPVRAIRACPARGVPGRGFGVVFLILKIVEWVRLIHMGDTFTSSQFFQYYFFLTAIHCVHLLVGFVVLGVLVYQLSSEKRRSQLTVETCATYWHSSTSSGS